jgi:hypothetical protein
MATLPSPGHSAHSSRSATPIDSYVDSSLPDDAGDISTPLIIDDNLARVTQPFQPVPPPSRVGIQSTGGVPATPLIISSHADFDSPSDSLPLARLRDDLPSISVPSMTESGILFDPLPGAYATAGAADAQGAPKRHSSTL